MKVKIKYSVLTYEGKKTSKTQIYDNCPDFEAYKGEPLILSGKQVTEGFDYTIEYQVDKWVEEFDKKDWMEENDVQIIFDWKVVSAKVQSKELIVKQKTLTQSEIVGLWLEMVEMSDGLKANFVAVYSEMKPVIKDFKFDKQIDITMKGLSVGFKSTINVYDSIKQFQAGLDKIKLDDYKTISFGKTSYNLEKVKENINNSLTE